ncbi:hypothetical protein BACEGG_00700 [Bacteroides eggerthii DSM 20697]|jgi:hypothetical protein|nr:hypothetical protein BACEGG_00700 [Bacteroides eggerthii DSM 20697]
MRIGIKNNAHPINPAMKNRTFGQLILMEILLWQRRKQSMYAATADKSRPNGWANARRAENGILIWKR